MAFVLGETCLTTFSDNCQCLNHQVPPHQVGSFFASWVKWIGGKQRGLNRYICWYDNLGDLRDASNSLWLHRDTWSVYHNNSERDYMGWNECPVTKNVRNVDLLDAIVIQLPLQHDYNVNMSLCDYSSETQDDVFTSLETMHQMGYTRQLPVVFLSYTRGMNHEWIATRIGMVMTVPMAIEKRLSAQEFIFSNGACLAIPEGCRDVYYFPYNNATNKCDVTSDVCINTEKRMNELPVVANDVSASDNETVVDITTNIETRSSLNRLLAIESAHSIHSSIPFPTMLSVFHMMAMSTVVAMLLLVRTLGHRRRTRRTSSR